MPEPASIPVTGLRRNMPFLGFITGNAVSLLGDAFRGFTLTLWVYEASGGLGLAVSALVLVQLLPSVLAGAMVGAFIDKWPDRRKILIVCDIARAVTGAGLIYCAYTNNILVCLFLVASSASVSVFASVAGMTLIPQLVPDDQLERSNSIWSIIEQLSFVVGPAAAAVSYTLWGPGPAFLLDASSFVMSAVILAIALPKQSRITNGPTQELEAASPSLHRSIAQGLRYLQQDKMIRAAVLTFSLRALSAGINNTVMIFFIAESLRRQSADLAWLGATNGVVQMVIGGVLIAAASKLRLPANIRAGAATMATGGLVIASAPNLLVLILGTVITSIGNAPVNISHNVLEQRYVPIGLLGRVRGLQATLTPLAFLVASTASGAMVNVVGARPILIGSAALLLAAMFVTELGVLTRLRARSRDEPSTPDKH
ncbi:MFS transporter [Paractinoplanes hotanensis]|uniref:MFS transporter n=1 Tax=Paractinoplanes hotanensis TaxID=2906497 RepID=A0ABT0Y9K7_9ACTN|nr:MFS transporter [Actinoplanes hotanensis]MCM4082188.1 MFS transporter [Actinoplanes hotanensis]